MSKETLASCAEAGTSNVKFHIVGPVEGAGLQAVCGASSYMSQQASLARNVPKYLRCKKPACAKAFATAKYSILR